MSAPRFDLQVDCLTNGAPHAPEAQAWVDYFRELPRTPDTYLTRVYTAFELFHKMEVLQNEPLFRMQDYRSLLRAGLEQARNPKDLGISIEPRPSDHRESAETQTQNHYSSLFEQFGDEHYYEGSKRLLKERFFDRNEIALGDLSGKTALDCGCGSGRFTLVLKSMGFSQVTGLDYSSANIKTAEKLRDARSITGVNYVCGNALEAPFKDGSFDFVLSNGVLHHTGETERGLREIHRLLRPGGNAMLFLLERPGGIFQDSIELLRNVMHGVPHEFALRAFSALGVTGHRLYNILDHLLVPINERLTHEELETLLKRAGFTRFRRLENGLSYDRTERLKLLAKAQDPEALWKYGTGENRYFLTR